MKMDLKIALQTLDNIPPIEGSHWGDAIIACREAARSILDPSYVHHYNHMVIYAVDHDGVHHVVERHWQSYMEIRPSVPHKVVIYDTFREFKQVLSDKGVQV